MSAFGKWLNRPRKRSQSSPTRQILRDFLNGSAPETEPGHQQASFVQEKHRQRYSSLPTHSGYHYNNTSTPMLITSSFYNLAYPFEQNDSSPDEEEHRIPVQEGITKYRTTSKPLAPSSSTNKLKKPQQLNQTQNSTVNKQDQQSKIASYAHNRDSISIPGLQHPLQFVDAPTDYLDNKNTEFMDTFNVIDGHSRNPVMWTRPDLVPLQPTFKRKPTPYLDIGSCLDLEEDEENREEQDIEIKEARDGNRTLGDQNTKTFTASPTAYNAEFEKLRTEIKKLEKSQKKRELRMHRQMMDTQHQLECLILSRSYDSNHPYSYHSHDGMSSSCKQYTNWNNDTATKATNSSSSNYQFPPSNLQQHQDTYWYNSYGGDYYYTNHTQHHQQPQHQHQFYDYPSSSEPDDYYQEQNEYDRSRATTFASGTHTKSAAIPISHYHDHYSKSLDNYYPIYYTSSAQATENERNYYLQHHPQMYHNAIYRNNNNYTQHKEEKKNSQSRSAAIPKNNSKNIKNWT